MMWKHDGCDMVMLQVMETMEQEAEITDVTEGTPYYIRVAAENEVGIGEFKNLGEPVVPKSQFGGFIPKNISIFRWFIDHRMLCCKECRNFL